MKYCFLFIRVKMEILFLYILYVSMLPEDKSLFFTFIDLSKPFVLHGFKICFVLRLDMDFNGAFY